MPLFVWKRYFEIYCKYWQICPLSGHICQCPGKFARAGKFVHLQGLRGQDGSCTDEILDGPPPKSTYLLLENVRVKRAFFGPILRDLDHNIGLKLILTNIFVHMRARKIAIPL